MESTTLPIMPLGQKLKKLRELRNFTQEHMARGLGMTQAAYSKVETGENDIGWQKIEKAAEILQVRPLDIVAFDEQAIFNMMHNGVVHGYYASTVHHTMPEELKKAYDDRVASLEREIEYLKSMVEKLLDK